MARGKVISKKQTLTEDELLTQVLVPEEEQPYPIPENWVWVRLGNVVQSSDEKFSNFSTENEIKYIGLEHIEKDAGIIGYGSANDVRSLKNVFSKGDILYGKLRPYLNKHGLSDFDGICSTDIMVLKPSLTAEIKLVDYYLNTGKFVEYAIANSKGINLPRLSPSFIFNASFPLPPLPEQRRIINHIESLFEKLDRAKELIQTAIDRFETRKTAILYKAFTGDLTTKWRRINCVGMESWKENLLEQPFIFKDEQPYNLPDNWVWTRLECVAKWGSGGTPSRKRPEFYNGNIPWIKTGELDDNFIYNTEEKITEDAVKESSAKLFPQNTVVVAMYGATIGKVAIMGMPATTNQACACAVSKKILYYKFLFFYLLSQKNAFIKKGKGGAQPNISQEIIKAHQIPLPPFSEQQEIVRILDSLLEKEQGIRELCDVIEKIDMMKKAILARAFRGMLGTNKPSEESAVGLLREVLAG